MLRELTGSIAKKYDQPEDILYRIFLPLIRRSESVSPGFSYPRLIEDSIKLGIPARRILNVIKSEGFEHLLQLIKYFQYLSNTFTPLYSVSELIDLLKDFKSHLIEDFNSLGNTGYPSKLFTKSKWLDSELNRLYYTRMNIARMHDGKIKYSWSMRREDSPKWIKCNYEEATFVHSKLSKLDVSKIEKMRPKIQNARINIIDILIEALKKNSIRKLWIDCKDEFHSVLSDSEIKLLKKLDNYYVKYITPPLSNICFPQTIGAGGLMDTFMLTGHVEQEIRSGSWSRLRSYLNKYIIDSESKKPRLKSDLIIGKFIFGSGEDRKSFYKLMEEISKREAIFWDEFAVRLNQQFKNSINDASATKSDVAFIRDYIDRKFNHFQSDKSKVDSFYVDSRREKYANIIKFPSPEGLKWEQVIIRFTSNDYIEISAGKIKKEYHFAQIGFKDRRSHYKPDTRWAILKGFADRGSSIDFEKIKRNKADKRRTEAAISELRKRLKNIIGIDDDPFQPYSRKYGYSPKFILSDDSTN